MVDSIKVLDEIRAIFKDTWKTRAGQKVPETAELSFGNSAVELDATVLYADMTESTELVNQYKPEFAAEIYKAYILGACRAIQNRGGEITAFDGDRVMALFIGSAKNTMAAKAALTINYVVREINVLLKQAYPRSSYVLRHVVGVDTSSVLVARTGFRDANDLVWVGRAPNYAAKLCALGSPEYPTHITEDVFKMLGDVAKLGGEPRRSMWERTLWADRGLTVYRSNWWWEL